MGVSAATPPVPGLTILFHPDLERVGERVLLPQLGAGREARLSRKEPGFSPPQPPSPGGAATARPLADPYLSRVPVRLLPAGTGAIRLLCDETRMPIVVGGVPVAGERLIGAAELERGVVLMLAHRVVVLLHLLDPVAAPAGLPAFGMIGDSAALVDVRREVQRLAPLDVAVMLRGETGTGKELVARALHDASRRAGGPFLAINLAAVPAQLAAAELFGAARGAFTGAERARPGYFGLAAGGTLLLDEIGEIPLAIQGKVLRVLEEHTFERVGGGRTLHADLRLVAATNRDLQRMVEEGRFRGDLYFRLAVFPIELPPLRERASDVPLLARHLLAGIARRHQLPAPRLAEGTAELLASQAWPGNVRELANVLERALILADGPELRPADLQPLLGAPAAVPPPASAGERDRLRRALIEVAGDKRRAAGLLGISYRALLRKVKEHDLEGVPRYRG